MDYTTFIGEPGIIEALEFAGIHIAITHFHQVVTGAQLQNLLVRESYRAVCKKYHAGPVLQNVLDLHRHIGCHRQTAWIGGCCFSSLSPPPTSANR